MAPLCARYPLMLFAVPWLWMRLATSSLPQLTSTTVKVFSPEGTLLHDRLGGDEMGDAVVWGGLAIDPSSGRIVVGGGETGTVNLL